MAYIIENDVRNLLTERDISILLEKDTGGNSNAFLTQRVLFAIDVVKSKIQHRYDPEQIFFDVLTFANNTSYGINSLIYYSEPVYDNTSTYAIDARISYNNSVYKAIAETTGNLPTDTNYWERTTVNKGYFLVIQETDGNQYPENTDYFKEGDTRHQLIFTYTLYIAVYELFKKIQPTQVPEWIISSRDEAIEHLARINRGTDTVLLPIYAEDDQKGQEITYDFPYTNQNYEF